jgi:protein-disulfide isomerase
MMRSKALLVFSAAALLSACSGAPQVSTSPSADVAVITSPVASAATAASPPAAARTSIASTDTSITEAAAELSTDAATKVATPTATEQSTTAATATVDENGAVTATMADLGIASERFAALGDPNAPITIVEYSDYGCPFCRRYTTETFPILQEQYIDTGKVFYVYKDLPIVDNHPQAALAAEAAECAGEQGQYWPMHEQLFAQPEAWDTTADEARASFERYAGELGMNGVDLLACLDQGRYRDEVQADSNEAREFGLSGTPSFVINGKLLVGAYPTEDFVRIVDRELANR